MARGVNVAWSDRRRKGRSGAFWEGRYHATMVGSGEYLWECLKYIELNMVRCGVVDHPSRWEWSGYGELMGWLSGTSFWMWTSCCGCSGAEAPTRSAVTENFGLALSRDSGVLLASQLLRNVGHLQLPAIQSSPSNTKPP